MKPNTPRLVLGEDTASSSEFDPGNPTTLTSIYMKARDLTGNRSIVEQQINSIQAYLRVYQAPLLTATPTYQRSSHPPAPLYFQKRKSASLQGISTLALLTHSANQTPCLPKRPGKPAVTHGEYFYISIPLPKGKARHLITNPRKTTILSGV